MEGNTKLLALTRYEAELLMDTFKVMNPLTRDIALKAAGLVLEFASEDNVDIAQRLVGREVIYYEDAEGNNGQLTEIN